MPFSRKYLALTVICMMLGQEVAPLVIRARPPPSLHNQPRQLTEIWVKILVAFAEAIFSSKKSHSYNGYGGGYGGRNVIVNNYHFRRLAQGTDVQTTREAWVDFDEAQVIKWNKERDEATAKTIEGLKNEFKQIQPKAKELDIKVFALKKAMKDELMKAGKTEAEAKEAANQKYAQETKESMDLLKKITGLSAQAVQETRNRINERLNLIVVKAMNKFLEYLEGIYQFKNDPTKKAEYDQALKDIQSGVPETVKQGRVKVIALLEGLDIAKNPELLNEAQAYLDGCLKEFGLTDEDRKSAFFAGALKAYFSMFYRLHQKRMKDTIDALRAAMASDDIAKKLVDRIDALDQKAKEIEAIEVKEPPIKISLE